MMYAYGELVLLRDIRSGDPTQRALPGESHAKVGVGAPPMCSLTRNWASGIPLKAKSRGNKRG